MMTNAGVVVILAVAMLQAACTGGGGALVAAPVSGSSRITRLDIVTRQVAFDGRSFGTVGQYEILIGTATAVIDPAAERGIVDLEKAPRNSKALVEYTFDVQILKPVDLAKGNGVLVYEVNNRGNRLVYGYFNEGGSGYEAGNIGNGFLMKNGYTVAWSGWLDGDSRSGSLAAPPPLFAKLPIATDNGRPIVGTAREEWIRDGAATASARLSYPAATLDQARATLTYRQNEADPRRPLSVAHWSYADNRTVKITPPADADAGTIYEFIYQATNPVVAGLGFASIRDVVSFLRYTASDDAGRSNPLFVNGSSVLKVAVSTGTSQSGRVQRDFLYQGFNRDAAGRKVFDGMNPIVAGGRRTFVNDRFAQPGRFTRQHEDHLYPMDEFPFTYGTTTDPLTGKTDGLLARCARSDSCPVIVQVDTDSEAYVSPGSLVVTDPAGKPIELPAGVRYYYLTTAHLQGNPACRDAAHAVSPFPYYRAAFEAMVRWVRDRTPPPATRAPSRADGTFLTVEEQRRQYPTIPGKPYNAKISAIGVRDFSVFPPTESAVKYPQFVPRLDRDGNPVAGVLIPEVVAPVATLSGKAVRGKGFAEGDLCGVYGSAIPFPKTKAERLASGDSRLSLEERYPGRQAEYTAKYRQAVEKLVAERYLLPEDGARLAEAARLPQ
jgi:alpha/beta hydrolase family protein